MEEKKEKPLLRSKFLFKKIKKIKPFHKKAKYNEIYCQSKRPIFAYLKRVKKLFLKGEEKITIFAMGRSIQKAVRLALLLKQQFAIEITTQTGTHTVFDQIFLTNEQNQQKSEIRERTKNTIKIEILYKLAWLTKVDKFQKVGSKGKISRGEFYL